MRKSVDSALKQSYFEAQENVAQSWEDRHPPYLCGKSSMALSCRNSLEVPGNNSVGMDGNPPPSLKASVAMNEVPPAGVFMTETGDQLEEDRCSWAYLSQPVGMPTHA